MGSILDCRESLFYGKIKSCIEKYLPGYSSEDGVHFESTCELSYGNSGFRDKYKNDRCDLQNVLSKSGILLGLLFIKYNYERLKMYRQLGSEENFGKVGKRYNFYNEKRNPWKNVGIVITASHNPHNENGIKIIDHNGRQINMIYEEYLSDLVNNHLRYVKNNKKCTLDDIIYDTIILIAKIFKEEIHIDLFDNTTFNSIRDLDDTIHSSNLHSILKGNICIGFDTRNSSVHLNRIIIESLHCLNIRKCINNMCYVTTPCMHFTINFLNGIFIDKKIDHTFMEKGEYDIRKMEDDLDFLPKFHVQNGKSVRELYYLYCGHSEHTMEGGKGRGIPIRNLLGVSLPGGIPLKSMQNEGEPAQDHSEHLQDRCELPYLCAYNSDQFYFDYFAYLFENLHSHLSQTYDNIFSRNCKEEIIYVDCSNGIASLKLDNFKGIFTILKKQIIKINYIRDEKSILNFECGADYVYSKRKLPINTPLEKINSKFCSFDGDADRIIYFFFNNTLAEDPNERDAPCNSVTSTRSTEYGGDSNVVILDGPKIACLFLKCIMKMLFSVQVQEERNTPESNINLSICSVKKLDINIIHTAYVNSAFIDHVRDIKKNIRWEEGLFRYINMNIICTKTGIKNLDNVAQKSSIGILFESNGHGTIYVDVNHLNEWSEKLRITEEKHFIALKKYLLFFNQTTGDAMIDFIAIELSLSFLNLTINQWNKFYNPLPSYYINVPCPKKIMHNIIPHPDHEKYLVEPKWLQGKIDHVVKEADAKYGRCFVRPSGTENIIRIYAEAQSVATVDEILCKVKQAVCQYMERS
ncbi:phosphoacetylglucosamine mutase, putative [Plasmodium ovale]|uniref:Phosphoacetylglucosamine mutase, putative n=2 Tax=Plasmodium ovale TaxID=36330 RepID=A0A1A8VTD8_PLAOA|nr:phosphoacetylglucosamine mutase, putative [Plasmodium ovale curtisi]SBS91438.1 phosphoacetylglucosamine mutase, putative [Plasmodium ovale curtisi]SCP04628.1 phosphoacetylglucosamine mutase, putative [Plasmodium ovale]